jgi:hypothetical protein
MRPIENMENLRTSCTVMYVQTVEIRLLSTNSYLFLGVNHQDVTMEGGNHNNDSYLPKKIVVQRTLDVELLNPL